MIKISKNSKFYIWCCEPNVRSGGVEVLNLLAADLKKMGINACLCNWFSSGTYMQGEYYKQYYDVDCGNWGDIKNSEDYVIIVPEICLEYEENIKMFSERYSKVQFMFWWLSTSFLYNYLDTKISKRIQFQWLSKLKDRSLHLCESEVSYRDCLYYGANNRVLLQHGLNPIIYEYKKKNEKGNIVFYNAYKSATRDFVESEIKPRMPEVEFIDVKFEGEFKGKEEMCDLFDKAKVYIDFCGFEGREMMPREACVRNCVLILGKEGNAATFDDYPIDEWYKVNKYDDPEIICEKIRICLNEYENRLADMGFFKNKCLYEPMKWRWELHSIFGQALP